MADRVKRGSQQPSGERGPNGMRGRDGEACAAGSGPSRERRRWPRLASERLVAYKPVDAQDTQGGMGMATILDLSEGGVKIQTRRPFPSDARFQIFMAVDEVLVEARGRMVHQNGLGNGTYEMGAALTHVKEKGKRFLTDLT
jgi:hypothetical protein